jgi:hypothetical protein
MSTEASRWRRCSTCKNDIDFDQLYWVCNVSTCNRKRTGTIFCSVSCWEAHVPIMRHRESWAVEKTSPTREAWAREQTAAESASRPSISSSRSSASAGSMRESKRESKRTLIRPASSSSAQASSEIPHDILIVASKMKSYIRAVSGMNTSDTSLDVLSDHVRALCDRAIREAGRDERKTVMGRDFPDPE